MHEAFILSYQLGVILFIFSNILESIWTTLTTIIYVELIVIPQINIQEQNDRFEAEKIQHAALILLKILWLFSCFYDIFTVLLVLLDRSKGLVPFLEKLSLIGKPLFLILFDDPCKTAILYILVGSIKWRVSFNMYVLIYISDVPTKISAVVLIIHIAFAYYFLRLLFGFSAFRFVLFIKYFLDPLRL